MALAKLPPVATGYVGAPIVLDGRASIGAKQYEWELLPAGEQAASLHTEDGVATLRADHAGDYVVKLTVKDESGLTDAALVVVKARRLSVTIEGPEEASQFDSLTLTAHASEELEGTVCTWTVSPEDGVTKRVSAESSTTATFVFSETGRYTVSADMASENGKDVVSATKSVSVTEPVPAAFADATYWQEEMLTGNREALTRVRSSASTWQGMLAGVLGLFGTVTLLGAPAALDEVPSEVMVYLTIALTAGAFVAAAIAVGLVTNIITTGTRIDRTPDAEDYGKRVLVAAAAATEALNRSKVLTFGAASLVAVAGLVLALAQLGGSDSTDDGAPLALVRTSTATICGPMSVDQETGALRVAGQDVGVTRSVDMVSECAAPPPSDASASDAMFPTYTLGLSVAAATIGIAFAFSHLSTRKRWLPPVLAGAAVYALAWGMSGRPLAFWHILALVSVAIAWLVKRLRGRTASSSTHAGPRGQQSGGSAAAHRESAGDSP